MLQEAQPGGDLLQDLPGDLLLLFREPLAKAGKEGRALGDREVGHIHNGLFPHLHR